MNTGRQRKLIMVLLVLTLCFIWGNSLLPATSSGALSGWVKTLINRLAGGLGVGGLGGDGLLRKLAHASEFGLLGLELTYLLWDRSRRCLPPLILCGLGAAFLDETIQLFVAGRAGQVQDIWIDLGGFAAGMALSMAITALRHRRNP